MKLQKLNSSPQHFALRWKEWEKILNAPLIFFIPMLAVTTSFGFWIFALYFAYLAIVTSFHSPETRFERVKNFALKLVCVAVIYLLAEFVFLYVSIPMYLVPLVALAGFFAALFACFKIYASYFKAEKIQIREIPVKSSKPTLFLNQ